MSDKYAVELLIFLIIFIIKIILIYQGTIIDHEDKEILDSKIKTHFKLVGDFKLIALKGDEDLSEFFCLTCENFI